MKWINFNSFVWIDVFTQNPPFDGCFSWKFINIFKLRYIFNSLLKIPCLLSYAFALISFFTLNNFYFVLFNFIFHFNLKLNEKPLKTPSGITVCWNQNLVPRKNPLRILFLYFFYGCYPLNIYVILKHKPFLRNLI